jgi:hypothetical protein
MISHIPVYRFYSAEILWLCLIIVVCSVDDVLVQGWSMVPMKMSITNGPKGSSLKPMEKQKILVTGCGGYLGAMTFGYLQRASSLYGTGIGTVRCIGATSDTSIRLNRVLGKHFTLAQADESYIKLTNLTSVDAIVNRMIGYDALVLGTNLYVQQRLVTANTYENTPNDKAYVINFVHRDLSFDIVIYRPLFTFHRFHSSHCFIQIRIVGKFIGMYQRDHLQIWH